MIHRPGPKEGSMKHGFVLLSLWAVAAAVGCASDPIITATGTAAMDAYQNRTDLSRGQKIALTKRAAMVDAQRNLLEEYAGTFLSSQTEIKDFVAKNDYIISKSAGWIKGVRRVSGLFSPDNSVFIVKVQARRSDVEAALKKRW
jgi:hypothetical protein